MGRTKKGYLKEKFSLMFPDLRKAALSCLNLSLDGKIRGVVVQPMTNETLDNFVLFCSMASVITEVIYDRWEDAIKNEGLEALQKLYDFNEERLQKINEFVDQTRAAWSVGPYIHNNSEEKGIS